MRAAERVNTPSSMAGTAFAAKEIPGDSHH
jgi:hypothetical protein